ncbi:MAG: DUF1294 domain-containing protein [Candidatus Paceibacterota bacterium]
MLDNILLYILITFAVINIITFFVMLVDKRKAINSSNKRIPEGKIFFAATMLGALGVYMGILIFHHKNRKWYFLIGMPILIIQNISLIYLAYLFLIKTI